MPVDLRRLELAELTLNGLMLGCELDNKEYPALEYYSI